MTNDVCQTISQNLKNSFTSCIFITTEKWMVNVCTTVHQFKNKIVTTAHKCYFPQVPSQFIQSLDYCFFLLFQPSKELKFLSTWATTLSIKRLAGCRSKNLTKLWAFQVSLTFTVLLQFFRENCSVSFSPLYKRGGRHENMFLWFTPQSSSFFYILLTILFMSVFPKLLHASF